MKNEIVHIFANYPHHVVNMVKFFQNIESQDNPAIFYIEHSTEEDKNKYSDISGAQIIFYKDFSSILTDIKKIPLCTVIFHSVFDYDQWVSLILSGLYKQSVWVCWGGDLYKHVLPKKSRESLKNRTKRLIELWAKRFLSKRLLATVALNNGDAKLLRQHFWGDKSNIRVLRYPMMGFDEKCFFKEASTITEEKGLTRIVCGNSADPSNNHNDMLDSLSNFKNENIQILMPLNYGGNRTYIDNVCKHGNSIFGDKFTPLTTFMEKKEYDNLLGTADIGVFFHNRQQGLYVACSLLLQGKLMYIRGNVSSYREFTEMGMKVGDSDKIPSTTYQDFRHIPNCVSLKNSSIAKRMFTEKYLATDWNNFFSELTTYH